MKTRLLILTLFLGLSLPAWACKCRGLEEINEQEIKQYHVIFRGTAIKVVENEEKTIITFRIDKLYKGELQATTLQIATPSDVGACGIASKLGEQWLIYAFRINKVYTTSLCTRTVNLNPPKSWNYADTQKRMQKDLMFLEERTKLKGKTNG